MRSLCAEVHPDDGIDPRESARGHSHKKTNRHARQLCRQVAETLGGVLASDNDDVLRNLQVVAVVPAPDASRLLVTVGAPPGFGNVNPADVLARLGRASGKLRCEVAAAITRKKAPVLVYRVLVSGEAGEEGPK